MYESFEAFWPFYLREHDKALTRHLHVFGTTVGLVLLAAAAVTLDWRVVCAGLLTGYLPPLYGHFVVQKKPPVGVKNPKFILWSFRGDFRLCLLFYTGKLAAEVKAQGIDT